MIAITPEGLFTAQQLKASRDTIARNLTGGTRGSTNQNLVVRPLLPADLYGGTPSQFSNTTAIGAADTPTPQAGLVAVPQASFYAIFGFAAEVATPLIQEWWIGDGSATYAKIRLAPIYAQGSARPRVGYFDPVYFGPNANPVFTFVASAAVLINAEKIEIIGLVAETPRQVRTQEPIAPGQAPTQVDG